MFGIDDALMALPAVASLGSAGVGLAGMFGGGQQEDPNQGARTLNNINSANQINVGLNDYVRGIQQLTQYQDLLGQLQNQWQQQSDAQWGQMQAAQNRYSPLEDAQAQAILQDMSLYQPYKQASVQTGLNALDYMNGQMDLARQTRPTQQTAIQDVNQALDMSMNTYRPMEQRMLGRLESEAVPAAQQSWAAAQDYFKTMKEGIDPNTWAAQAGGDVAAQFGTQRAAMGRNRAAMGVDPSSGNAQAADLDMAVNEALQGAGASTKARQAGVLQNLQNYGTGLSALQSSAGQLANTYGGITNTVQKGPMSFGLPIFQQTANFNPNSAKAMMMDPASSLSAGALMKSYQANPTNISSLVSQLGSMGTQNTQNLYNAYGNAKIGSSGSSQNQSGAGFGALTGYGLSGLTSKAGVGGLEALANMFGGGSGGTASSSTPAWGLGGSYLDTAGTTMTGGAFRAMS